MVYYSAKLHIPAYLLQLAMRLKQKIRHFTGDILFIYFYTFPCANHAPVFITLTPTCADNL